MASSQYTTNRFGMGGRTYEFAAAVVSERSPYTQNRFGMAGGRYGSFSTDVLAGGGAPSLVWGTAIYLESLTEEELLGLSEAELAGLTEIALFSEAGLAGTSPSVEWEVGTSVIASQATISGTSPALEWEVGVSLVVEDPTLVGIAPSLTWEVGASAWATELSGLSASLTWEVAASALASQASLSGIAPSMVWSSDLASLFSKAILSGSSPHLDWVVAASIVTHDTTAWFVVASQLFAAGLHQGQISEPDIEMQGQVFSPYMAEAQGVI